MSPRVMVNRNSRGEATLREAARQVVNERRRALFGVFLRQQQDHVTVAFDLAAHQSHDLLTQVRHFAGQIVEGFEWDLAHHRGFQRLSETWVLQTADGVEAHQITRQMETGDLLVALLGDGVAFDGPGTDRVQRLQLVAGLEQGLAFLDGLFLSIMLSSWSSSWALG